MVVGQRDVFDGLVRDLTNAADHVLRHDGRGLGIDDHHSIVANDDAGVGIALGRIGVGMFGKLVEAHLLDVEIGGGGKGLGVHGLHIFV